MIAACPPVWLFLWAAPRRVEVDVLAGIAATGTRAAAVNLTGFVVDVGTLAGLRRDVATIGSFVSAGIVGTVTVLQMALRCVASAIVFVAGVTAALAETVRGSIGVAGLDADVVDGLGCVAFGHRDLLRFGTSNAQADIPDADSLAGQQPLPCFGGLTGEVLNVSTFCGPLDLHPSERFARDDRDALGLGSWIVQNPLESDDCVLRLNHHLTHVDQREMLVRAASKLSVGNVSFSFECIDCRLGEEPTYDDCHQVERRVGGDSKSRSHAFHLGSPAYQRVARNLKNLPALITADVLKTAVWTHRLFSAPVDSSVVSGVRILKGHLLSRPLAEHGEVTSTIGAATIDRMVTGSLGATVGWHSALLLGWMRNQPQHLTSICLYRLYRGLVPNLDASMETRGADGLNSDASTTHGEA